MNIPAIIVPTNIELATTPTSEVSQEVAKVIDYIPEEEGKSYLLIDDKEKLLAETKVPIMFE